MTANLGTGLAADYPGTTKGDAPPAILPTAVSVSVEVEDRFGSRLRHGFKVLPRATLQGTFELIGTGENRSINVIGNTRDSTGGDNDISGRD